MVILSSLVFFILFAATSVVDVVLADEESDSPMIPIDDSNAADYQSIDGIKIDPSCTNGSSVPVNTMFSVFPYKNGVYIATKPADLVTAVVTTKNELNNRTLLEFEWNKTIDFTATKVGVKIGVPSNQLLSVSIYGLGHRVQIDDGFTNLTTLHVGSGSTLRASMTSLVSEQFELNNDGGRMFVQTNIPVTYGSVYGGGQSWVETKSLNRIDMVGVGSERSIKGDVVDVGKLSDDAKLIVEGTISGHIIGYNNSVVNTLSCDNVTLYNGSKCNAGQQNINIAAIILKANSQTLTGTQRCGDSSVPSSVFTRGYTTAITIVFSAATVMLI
mmetsp:Transcript_43181/g.43889  ORF Transcript_43181/g.43889 Transcript_43181/m.43889 type:complete len:329 (+) Transcript_43181:58-1044(+)